MESFEYIDNYFKGEKLPDETRQFEERISSDPSFAEEVAFYIAAQHTIKEKLADDKKQAFRQLYDQTATHKKTSISARMMPYMAAAACIVIVLGIWMLKRNPTSQTIAEKYIQQNLQTLSVQMAARPDSIQLGIQLYNSQKYTQALQLFDALLLHTSNDFTAKKYAGIVSLQLKQYDKALIYFSSLEEQQGLYANPGKFYHALTLMRRGTKEDKAIAKRLLQEVAIQNLEGKETAEEWVKQL